MANEPMIPAGMKPWAGGDAAPADWDGGPVFYANGVTAQPLDHGDWQRPADIPLLAYTPRTPTEPESGAADERVRVLREALEPFAKACTISTYADADVIDDTLAANKITWGHLRRALSALADLPQPDAKEGGDA